MATPILSKGKGKKPQIKDRTGVRYGRLVAVQHVASLLSNGCAIWRCLCDCWKYHDVEGRLLGGRQGTNSCGCLQKDSTKLRPLRNSTNATHGESGTKSAKRSDEYKSWSSMIQRCTNKNHASYSSYGGRGISVCKRWIDSYEDFLSDVGRRPSNTFSLDRVDVNGDYSPDNCRWATIEQQANNRRSNRLVFFYGKEMTCTELAKLTGISSKTVFNWANKIAPLTDMTCIISAKRPASVFGH